MALDQTTITKVLAANYAAAALLAAAAQEVAAAAEAAETGQNNLALGTAIGAQTAAAKALCLIEAAATIRASA